MESRKDSAKIKHENEMTKLFFSEKKKFFFLCKVFTWLSNNLKKSKIYIFQKLL